jgi:hypothetical protein
VKKDIVITQGSDYLQEVRWETSPIVYKPIAGITNAAPVSIHCIGHGVPDGWNVAIVSVKGMEDINATSAPPKLKDYHEATLTDVDNITLNSVNAADFGAYTSGGYVQYNTPTDLAGYTARMTIKDRVGGLVLATLTDANAKITVDNTNKVIKIKLGAVETAGYVWSRGVYDLELVSATGVVTSLLSGSATLIKEVTN